MLLKKVGKIIPKLSPDFYKGQAGRICIIGGSADYTGAPYYAAISCLKAVRKKKKTKTEKKREQIYLLSCNQICI